MSPAVANGLVVSFTAFLTLLLAVMLTAVIRLPPSPPLNLAAKQELDELDTQFKDELRTDVRIRVRARGQKQVKKKDIRVEYRKRRVWKASRVLTGATRYGGITISGAGVAIVVPSVPHFPPVSAGVTRFLGVAGAVVAAIAMVWDSSEFIRDTFERRRKSRDLIGVSAEEYGQLPAFLAEPITERAETELRRYCMRLAKDVEKEARRWGGEEEITPEDIGEAWRKLVRPRVLTTPAVRSRKTVILLGLTTLAELIAVAGVLSLVFFSLVKTKLPAGQYWPVVVTVAALFFLYLVLLNGPRFIAAAWKRRRVPLTTISMSISELWGSLAWLVRKGWALVRGLRMRRGHENSDSPETGPDPGKEGLARAERAPDRDKGEGAEIASKASQVPADVKNGRRAVTDGGDNTRRSPGLASLVATMAESLGILNKGSARAPAVPSAEEAAQKRSISSNSLNVTRVGGITSLIAAGGVVALLILNVNKATDHASTIAAAYISAGVIVAGGLLAVAVIITADIRARASVATSANPATTPGGSPGHGPAVPHASVRYIRTDAGASLDQAYEYVLVDAAAEAINVTLPNASSVGWQQMTIKRIDTVPAHSVTVSAQAPDTIAGQATYTLLPQNPVLHIYSDEHLWLTI